MVSSSLTATPAFGDEQPFARVADDDETIFAVQRKAYLVKGRFELTPFGAASFADRFVQTFAAAGSVVYHPAENFGIEAFGALMFPTESGLTNEILEKGRLVPETAKLTQMLWAAGAGVLWSPIYGKIELLGVWLGNFSFYIGVGAAIGQTRVRCTQLEPLDPSRFGDAFCPEAEGDGTSISEVYEPATLRLMGTLSGGVRFAFSTWVALRFEVKDYLFVARVFRPRVGESSTQRFTDAVRSNLFAQLGVSFFLGGDD